MNINQDLQSAIVSRWNVSGVNLYFSEAPKTADYPFAVFFINDISIEKQGGEDCNTFQGDLQFNIWSANTSSVEINSISDSVFTLYHRQNLSLSNHNSSAVTVTGQHVFKNEDLWQSTILGSVVATHK